MAETSARRASSLVDRLPIGIYIGFILLLCLCGGSSRFDSPAQSLARASATAFAAAALFLPRGRAAALRPAILFVFCCLALVLLQLVPLPPTLWATLPGHGHYASLAAAGGLGAPWRPINLAPDRGWNAFFALLVPGCALLILTRMRVRDQASLLAVLAVAILACAMLSLVQWSSGEDAWHLYTIGTREVGIGFFSNRNHAAVFFACGIPITAAWARAGNTGNAARWKRTLIACGVMTILTLSLPATGSRAAFFLLAPALLTGTWLIAPIVAERLQLYSKGTRIAMTSGVALLALILLASIAFGDATSTTRLFDEGLVDRQRQQALGPALDMARRFFPFGIGFGAFDPVYRGFEPLGTLGPSYLNEVHNDYVQVGLEGGLAGLALLATGILWWLWASIKLWRPDPSKPVTPWARAGSAVILLILIGSLTDYPARTPLIMMLLTQGVCWMLLPSAEAKPASACVVNFTTR